MRTGFSINPDDYNPSSPNASQNLAKLFNDIPKIAASWETSGKFVTDLWKILLTTGKAPNHPPPKDLKQQYEDAIIKLYGSKENYDKLEKSEFYKSIDKAENNVREKQFDLLKLKLDLKKELGPDVSQAEYNRYYEQMSATAVQAVTNAQEELMHRQREIDRYTTVLYAYNTGSLETVLRNFATSKCAL